MSHARANLDLAPRGYIRATCKHCEAATALVFPVDGEPALFCERCGAIDRGDTEAGKWEGLREPHTDEWERLRHLRNDAHLTIQVAIDKYEPSYVFGAISGGHDSLVSTHVTATHPAFDAACHINTGIGIKQTRQFVRATCWYFGWELKEYRATDYERRDGTPDPQVYSDLVEEWGFPGPPHHQKMYDRLKRRALNQMVREHKEHMMDKIMICSGVRREESSRRMGYKDPVDVDGAKVWVNPCLEWSKADCTAYMDNFMLPENEVVRLLCMSGECLCGAFAKEGELEIIEACFPEEGARLRELEKRVQDEGFPWGWDERPPKWWSKWKKGQQFLPGLVPDGVEVEAQPMCASCNFKHERDQGRSAEDHIAELEVSA